MKPSILDITPRYVVDNEGNRTAVLLDIKQFEQLMADLEDFYLGKLAESTLKSDKERYSLESVKKDLFKKLDE